jgi:hypothetical protein
MNLITGSHIMDMTSGTSILNVHIDRNSLLDNHKIIIFRSYIGFNVRSQMLKIY